MSDFINNLLNENKNALTCLENEENISLSNFLIKKIRKIKIATVLWTSKNGCQDIFGLINLIIKLINYFFHSSSYFLLPTIQEASHEE